MNATSPSKTITEQTISPWKIRVTVETEPEDMSINPAMSASRTIMVPLRDASSPTEERTRNTRGRGCQPSTVKSKRNATPIRKNSRSRSRRQSVTDLNITVLGDEGDSDDWTKQRSPKKKKSTPSRKPRPTLNRQITTDKQLNIGRSERRSAKSARSIEIREDTDADEDAVIDTAVDSDSPELRSIDLNRVSVRSRSISSKQQPPNLVRPGMSPKEEEADQGKDAFGDDPKNVSVISTSYPTPDPSVQDDQEVGEPAAAPPDDHEGFDTILESEGFTMIDLESIPSARQFFTSPSEAQGQAKPPGYAATLHSNDKNPPTLLFEQDTPSAVQPTKPVNRAIPSYLSLPEGESDISSNVPSSPPILLQPQRTAQTASGAAPPRETTPQINSSPKLPSPPKGFPQRRSKHGGQLCKSTPLTLAKVVKAGIALQGVLSPDSIATAKRTPGSTSEERLNNLFEGFDSGTRRELRAGLRLGEELAKRQRSSPKVKKPSNREGLTGRIVDHLDYDNLSADKHVPATQIWRGETVVRLAPLPLPTNEGKEDSTSKAATCYQDNRSEQSRPRQKSFLCKEINFASSTSQTNASCVEPKSFLDSQKYRELEWQRERVAVSEEIENASSSQVVVIDSDHDDNDTKTVSSDSTSGLEQGELSELDIWCEEAASCDQRSLKGAARPLKASRVAVSPEVEQSLQQSRGQDVTKKPRRSVIPSPWRRGEVVAGESSCLTNGDMTGLFYHEPKTKIKFGTAEIERQKRQYSSGSFDIDRMAGTPRKDHAVDSHLSADEIESPKTIDSDVMQLQAELKMNYNQSTDTADISQADPEEASTQQSLLEEVEVEHIEAISQLTEGDISLSLPPQPVKIPVNFNDSTISNIAPCLSRSSPSTAPESSRPGTPRSALKGARQHLGLKDANSPAVRQVVFSSHEIRVDLDGQEEQLSMQSVSSSPEVAQDRDDDVASQPSPLELREILRQQTSGLLGWLWSGSKKSESNGPPSVDGANDQDLRWHKTETPNAPNPTRSSGASGQIRTPSYLRPPSYPSDPTRDTGIPLSTSGEFTDAHFRTLHIIYAKSLRPRFHAPKAYEIRPNLRRLLSTAFKADESQSGLGIFEWKVDAMALRVVERFMREIEWGYPAGDEVKWVWSEKEICERLFRIVVGEEVRREEKAAREQGAA